MTLGLSDGILIWIFMWTLFWGVFVYFLRPRGVDYVTHYGVTSVYFLSAAGIIVYLLRDYFVILTGPFSATPFYALAAALTFDVGLYLFVNKYDKEVSDFIYSHRQMPFLLMDWRYIVSKLANIVFQQSLIVFMAILLADNGLGLRGITLAFAILFVSGHFPMLKLDGKGMGSLFIVAAAIAALFFPYLILMVNYGFIYAFIVHQAFYMASGIIFWFYFKKVDQGALHR